MLYLFLLPWLTELIHDGYTIEKRNRSPRKWVGILLRVVVTLVVTDTYLREVPLVREVGLWGALSYCFYWAWGFHFALFNYTLNSLTGKPWDHLGDNAWDRFEAGMNQQILLIVRAVILASVFGSYYLNLPEILN